MTERIKEAIDIFLDAVNAGTLIKGTCTACAVGNLVAAGYGKKIEKVITDHGIPEFICDAPNDKWGEYFCTGINGTLKVYTGIRRRSHNMALENISKTKFSTTELMKIENVFENNTFISSWNYSHHTKDEIKADQIKGLSAVIEVMKTFDNVEFSTQEEFVDKLDQAECIV